MPNFYRGKSIPYIWTTSLIFTKLPKVNNSPTGQTAPNLVTLPLIPLAMSERFKIPCVVINAPGMFFECFFGHFF
jgi:hypothetical protein